MKFFITLIVVFLMSAGAFAQHAEQTELKGITSNYNALNPVGKVSSLLDLSKINWSHSYSVSYFSGGGNSGSYGLYTGDIFYEFSSSLSLNVRLGIAHNLGGAINDARSNDASLYPAFQLDYRPSENFHLSIGYEKIPGNYYNPYDNYWRSLYR